MVMRFLLSAILIICGTSLALGAEADPGTLPVGADGKPLNLDFETGTLKDWTAEGDAFAGQPIKGDTVVARGRGMKSGHQGDYWIGGYETAGDNATGTLTSAPFKVTARWATMMFAGGHWPTTRVELLTAKDNAVFFRASGTDRETLQLVLADLEKQKDQEIRIRLVDDQKGAWGHVNFDNFRFHATKPVVNATAIVAAKAEPARPADQFKFAGLSPAQAAKEMTLPPGFKCQVFAAEPDIINPIAFTIDERGRLWVVQSLTYPIRAKEGEGKDSIFIFEDTDGDGHFDKKTVFAEKLNLVSGIEVGFGGVYVGAAPYLMFIPARTDANGVTSQAGEPQILLDGFGYQDTHETLNSFTWGPDGWLYGCHGVFTHSNVGKPGTPKEERVHLNAGVWRYHPTKHIFERFAEGTSNPWGMDFDEHGQLFIEACVIPHLWHMIQNARYQRQGGQHDNPYTFDDIKQIADHVHYLGATPHSGNGNSDTAGGGHAHSGLMCYLGDNWPDEYRGKLFMNNIHGARINMDIPEPQGSGFVGRHGKDFLLANDRASQIMAMKYGPDGSVYMIDWYDLNQCHSPNPTVHDRTTGRIFRVSYGDVKAQKAFDLSQADEGTLLSLQTKREWFVRQSRRVLQERAATGKLAPHTISVIRGTVESCPLPTFRLSSLWTLHACGATEGSDFLSAMSDRPGTKDITGQDALCGWAVQLACEAGTPAKDVLDRIIVLAKNHPSPVVRTYTASAIIRLPVEQRWEIITALLAHPEDATDHNLPLMYWYGLEPLLDVNPERALDLAATTKIPGILSFSIRKLASIGGQKELDALAGRLGKTVDDAKRLEILRGMSAGLKGRRNVAPPVGWDELAATFSTAKQMEIATAVRSLSVIFGSKAAMAGTRRTLLSREAPIAERLAAMESLTAAHDEMLALPLLLLVEEPDLRSASLRALAAYDNPQIPDTLLAKYASFSPADKKDVLLTLSSRAGFAKALLLSIGKSVPKSDFSADVLRQLRNLKNDEVAAELSKHWAAVRDSEKDKLDKIALWKKRAADPAMSAKVNPSHGRAVFAKTCAACHTLFGEGGKVGPDITGSDRANVDYLLTNVVDPNAVIPAEYLAWDCTTKDDRTLTGVLKSQDVQSVTLQTVNELITLPRKEILTLKASKLSMMPEALLDNLAQPDVLDLLAYLRSPVQIPMLADAESAKGIFNGKDLTGWEWQEENLWSVDNGEIMGKTATGLKKNQFLTTKQSFKDFRLILKIKLVPDTANSGIQFRSVRIPNSHEMKGCQADAGQGWWGKLYEESARGLLFPKKGQEFDATPFLKKGDWNTYEVLAVGGKIRTAINGHLCTDLGDDQIAKEGLIGLQVHAGGPTEVRFKDFELEIDPKFELKTVK